MRVPSDGVQAGGCFGCAQVRWGAWSLWTMSCPAIDLLATIDATKRCLSSCRDGTASGVRPDRVRCLRRRVRGHGVRLFPSCDSWTAEPSIHGTAVVVRVWTSRLAWTPKGIVYVMQPSLRSIAFLLAVVVLVGCGALDATSFEENDLLLCRRRRDHHVRVCRRRRRW